MGKTFQLDDEEEVVHRNLCIECGVDMGDCNPRQLCGKLYCRNPPLLEEESSEQSRQLEPIPEERWCVVCAVPIDNGERCGRERCLNE